MALAGKQSKLLAFVRQGSFGLARSMPATLGNAGTAGYASNAFDDKERAEENIRFRKEDERLLRQLLNKVKKQADAVDIHEAANTQTVDLAALKEILGKYNVSDDDLKKLLEWKHA